MLGITQVILVSNDKTRIINYNSHVQKNIEKVITLGSTSFRDVKTNERCLGGMKGGSETGIRMAVSGSGWVVPGSSFGRVRMWVRVVLKVELH